MSAQIYQDIREAMKRYYPQYEQEFRSCTNKETITAFMNKNFNLGDGVRWEDMLLTRIPSWLKDKREGEQDDDK